MSNQSGKIGAELDRENAHFSVSEAMIAAIEEVLTHNGSRLLVFIYIFFLNYRQDFMNGKTKKRLKKTNNSY